MEASTEERERAEAILAANGDKVVTDPTRPQYHFLPRSGWMNDPNGTIYHDGWYHVFYQHNPYGDIWNSIHWGHARSKDLVHWEHQPIALYPSRSAGEESCFSGCCTLTASGKPIIFYTKTGPRPEKSPREQWAALGDKDLVTWKKHPANPILAVETHGGPAINGEWRDPFVFHTEGKTFMLVTATLADQAGGDFVVLLYESTDDELSKWQFRNILIRKPGYEMSFFECPNFVQFGDRWMLLVSPYKPVEYYSGTFSPGSYTFAPTGHGRLDAGMDYYATNTAFAPDGRTILYGWVRGFRRGRGWDGCLALPRELDMDKDGAPIQRPVRELQALRGKQVQLGAQEVGNEELVIDESVALDCAEIACTFESSAPATVELRLLRAADGRSAVSIQYDGQVVDVHGTKVAYESDGPVSFHIYVDRTVIEVFIDGGKKSLTKVVYTDSADTGLSIRAHGGSVKLHELQAWKLDTKNIVR